MSLRRKGGWRRRTSLSWLATAPQSSPSLCCTAKVYHPLCHCALLLCHASSIKRFSWPTYSLAALLGVNHAGLGISVLPQVPWCGRSCRTLRWHVERVLGVPFPPRPPSTSMPPAGQALLVLLHPSVTVLHFCEPAKAQC